MLPLVFAHLLSARLDAHDLRAPDRPEQRDQALSSPRPSPPTTPAKAKKQRLIIQLRGFSCGLEKGWRRPIFKVFDQRFPHGPAGFGGIARMGTSSLNLG